MVQDFTCTFADSGESMIKELKLLWQRSNCKLKLYHSPVAHTCNPNYLEDRNQED
jgi:hypothetical protein